jgi:hypothetical protein
MHEVKEMVLLSKPGSKEEQDALRQIRTRADAGGQGTTEGIMKAWTPSWLKSSL